MVRVSKSVAQANRKRVIDVAARLLRTHGYDGIGIADLMKEAGLTHGGFYRNFTSRDDLLCQATRRMTEEKQPEVAAALASRPEDPFGAIVDWYLSSDHRDDPGGGCILPALGSEAHRRRGSELASVFKEAIRNYLKVLTQLRPDMPEGVRKRPPEAILAQLVGAILLARATDDPDDAQRLLEAAAADLKGQIG